MINKSYIKISKNSYRCSIFVLGNLSKQNNRIKKNNYNANKKAKIINQNVSYLR